MELIQAYKEMQIKKYEQGMVDQMNRMLSEPSTPNQSVSMHLFIDGTDVIVADSADKANYIDYWPVRNQNVTVKASELPWYQRRVRELSENMINQYAQQL